jgi:hypothetical protein
MEVFAGVAGDLKPGHDHALIRWTVFREWHGYAPDSPDRSGFGKQFNRCNENPRIHSWCADNCHVYDFGKSNCIAVNVCQMIADELVIDTFTIAKVVH